MKHETDISKAIEQLAARISEASSNFHEWIHTQDEYDNPEWLIESCFLQLLAISESLRLTELSNLVVSEYKYLKSSKHSFIGYELDPDGDPYSLALSRLRCFSHAIKPFYSTETNDVTKNLLEILRDCNYTINNKVLFHQPPQNENDVHARIEGILKPLFPDLKHKPTLTKQIKNFEPDTGIPSMSTLIEYKFITRIEDSSRIADEILADTRGYISRDWKQFVFVIYETVRCKNEKDWNTLLRESGVSNNTAAIVLCGEPKNSLTELTPRKKAKSAPKP